MMSEKSLSGRVLAVLLAGVLAGGCVPDEPERLEEEREAESERAARESPATSAGRVPEVEPIETRVFETEDADFAPGHRTYHLIVPFDASQEQVRQTLFERLNGWADEDTTLVAIRTVAYKPRPARDDPAAAELVPVAWGEWLPPGGWSEEDPGARESLHRVYTYFGTPPEW